MTAALTLAGGPVMKAPHVYVAFWGSSWQSRAVVGTDHGYRYTSATVRRYVRSFFASIGSSSWARTLTQYQSGRTQPAQLVGTYVDVRAIPRRVTMTQIAREADRAWHHFGSPDPANSIIVVLTPKGHTPSIGRLCGYHDVARHAPYIYIPFVPDTPGCGRDGVNPPDATGRGYLDGYSIIGAHELAETITDPTFTGWYDRTGNEIADRCAWTAPLGDVMTPAGLFGVPSLWSNQTQSCVLPERSAA